MNICIGGDLDGQVIDQEGRYLKASKINPEFKTEYLKQLFIQDDKKWYCWIDISMPFSKASDQAFNLFRKQNGFVS
ncbi:hypothetical protein KSB07_03360 [Acinetobacter junii]|uniref:hypothetical protein n=1 Tax=Acinetobacter junii TaxID=40215 RepID=UPI001F28B469|nr:hypothetical protein [Acinetobacter junii]MCE6003396.1 hypothetical protein [Acinetobacter junii]